VSHYSRFLPNPLTAYTLILLLVGSASLTILSGCGNSLPPKSSQPSTSSPSTEATAPVTEAPTGQGKAPSPEGDSTSNTQPTESKSDETAVLRERQLVEQDIIMLASNGVDPFSIAMNVQPIEVKEEDLQALSPYYQSLIGISPLVTVKVIKVEKPVTDPVSGMLSVPIVDPTIAMQEALSAINVNGISYKKSSPMAILVLSGKEQSSSTTLFVKKGSRLFVNGYSVLVEDITTSTVRISTSQGHTKVSQTLRIQDIFGFARSGSTGAVGSSSSTEATGGGASSGGASPASPSGTSKNVSSQDIDKIIKDLLN
jgi:hypothetical protein